MNRFSADRARVRRRAPSHAPAHVQAQVSDPALVRTRREQIVGAAVRLFSTQGYYNTTIQAIAREAGCSAGLIYQYFHDKDDILLLSLKLVLETYEREIPLRLQGFDDPLERLCRVLWAYCDIVDGLRDATVLAYRSTKSLRADRRALVKEGETRTNRLIEACLRACIAARQMRPVNEHLLAYQFVMFCHAWALKHWAFRARYRLARYVAEGVRLLIEPFLTPRGAASLAAMRRRSRDFSQTIRAGGGAARATGRVLPKTEAA